MKNEKKKKKKRERDKYSNLTRELKKNQRKLWHMRVTVIPIVMGTLESVPKGLEK